MSFENHVTLSGAAALFPAPCPHSSTIWRWCRRGLNGIKLRHIRAGRKILIRPEDVEEFCRAVAQSFDEEDDAGGAAESNGAAGKTAPRTRSQRRRERDRERARKRLDRAGI